ncbi:hypothetical protein [Streptomyces sp. NPDC048462]|uniref:hypothetical protein n=1 Tax=Streptomyces sp. NPDC048462 TaxID=3365555 RepID=UPI00371802CC
MPQSPRHDHNETSRSVAIEARGLREAYGDRSVLLARREGRAAAAELRPRLDLTEAAGKPATYSGGMKRRLEVRSVVTRAE